MYIDDIIIFSPDLKTHVQHVHSVLKRLKEANLRLKPSKCTFAREEVKILGYIINATGVHPDPDKTSAIQAMSPPKNQKQLRSCLGMTNYYRTSIPNYALKSAQITDLLKKNSKFNWQPKHQQAFQELKQALVSAPILAYPRTDLPYSLFTDASDNAIGAVLIQTHENGTHKAVHYHSQQLTDIQKRWSTIEKEAFAIVTAVQKLRPYLLGAEFTIYTDHKPLLSLFDKKLLNAKLARWALVLSEYSAPIKYFRGSDNVCADFLSRQPNQPIAVLDVDHEWVSPETYPDAITFEQLPCLLDNLDLKHISETQKIEFPDLFQAASDPNQSEYIIINEVLYSARRPTKESAEYPRLVLPTKYRDKVITRAHKEVGHMATLKTLNRLRESYIWPGMRPEIRAKLAKCTVCIAHSRTRDKAPMGNMPQPVSPMQMVSMDLIGPFVPSTEGNNYVLTVIDNFTGFAEAYPLPSKCNQTVWKAFSNHFIPSHGVPEVVLTYNAAEFCTGAFMQYMKDIGIDHRRSTPTHPASNGRIERFNRSFKEILNKLINNKPGQWKNHIGGALFAHRISISSVTGYSPFYLLYGRQPRAPVGRLLQAANKISPFGNRLDDLSEAFAQAYSNSQEARECNKKAIDKKANAKQLQVGDTVVLLTNEPITFSTKWDPQWQIIRISGLTCYLRNQVNGERKRVHRHHVKLVDPDLVWDELQPRPKRSRHRPVWDNPITVTNNILLRLVICNRLVNLGISKQQNLYLKTKNLI